MLLTEQAQKHALQLEQTERMHLEQRERDAGLWRSAWEKREAEYAAWHAREVKKAVEETMRQANWLVAAGRQHYSPRGGVSVEQKGPSEWYTAMPEKVHDQRLDRASGDFEELVARNADVEQRLSVLKTRLADAETRLAAQSRAKGAAVAETKRVIAARDAAKAALTTKDAKIAGLASELAATQDTNIGLGAELHFLKAKVKATTADIRHPAAEARYAALEAELSAAHSTIDMKTSALTTATVDLERARNELSALRTDVLATAKDAGREYLESMGQVAIAEIEIVRKQCQHTILEERERYEAKIGELEGTGRKSCASVEKIRRLSDAPSMRMAPEEWTKSIKAWRPRADGLLVGMARGESENGA